jgi:hypothetical protein
MGLGQTGLKAGPFGTALSTGYDFSNPNTPISGVQGVARRMLWNEKTAREGGFFFYFLLVEVGAMKPRPNPALRTNLRRVAVIEVSI